MSIGLAYQRRNPIFAMREVRICLVPITVIECILIRFLPFFQTYIANNIVFGILLVLNYIALVFPFDVAEDSVIRASIYNPILFVMFYFWLPKYLLSCIIFSVACIVTTVILLVLEIKNRKNGLIWFVATELIIYLVAVVLFVVKSIN